MRIKLKKKAYKFSPEQESCLEYAKKNRQSVFIGLDTRMGKTAVTSRFIKWLQDTNQLTLPTLIICPSEVIKSWLKDLYMEGVKDVVKIDGSVAKKTRQTLMEEKHQVYIVNKEGVIPQGLYKFEWGCQVVDEAHILTNIQSSSLAKHLHGKRTTYRKKRVPGMPRAEFRVALNGNPFSEGAETIVNQMLWLRKSFMGISNWWEFRNTYMKQDPFNEYDWSMKEGVESQIISLAHRYAFIKIRKSGEKKIYKVIKIPMPMEIKKPYKMMEKFLEADGVSTNYPMTKYQYMYRIAQGHHLGDSSHRWQGKIDRVVSLIKEDYKDRPVIVWCRYTQDLELLSEVLYNNGISHRAVYGQTSKDNRTVISNEFEAGKFQVVLIQFKTGYRGTRYAKAVSAIYMNNEFSGDMRSQSEDRHIDARVSGYKDIVDVVVKGSIDEKVMNLARNKHLAGKSFMSALHQEMMTQ